MSRSGWRPPRASHRPGSPGCIGPTPVTTCATPKGSGRRCARPAAAAPPATASPSRSPATCRRTGLSAADTGSGPAPPPAPTPASSTSAPFPEVLRAQRRHRHLAQLHHPWRLGDAVRDATGAIHRALRGGTWIPGQQRRMRQLAPGTWHQALAGVLGVSPGWPGDGPSHPVVEIAIYPRRHLARRTQPPGAQRQLPHPGVTHRPRRHAEMPHIRWQTGAHNHPTPCHTN